jgi:alanine dehydrogenase
MPGAVPHTSTYALTNATLPYVVALADKGLDAVRADVALAKGMNVYKGAVVYQPVAEAHGMEYVPLDDLL